MNTETVIWVERVLCIYIGYTIFGDIRLISVTRQAYGKIPFFEMLIMLRFLARTRIILLILSPIGIALLALIVSAAGMATFPFEFQLALFLWWLHIMLYQLTPPSVLLLSSSRTAALFLREWLERSLFPYRVIALLDSSAPDRSGYGWFQRNLFNWDNFRTLDGIWEPTVHGLAQMTPFIALDTRRATDGVVREAEHIVAQGLHRKTVFVTNVHGRAPVVEAANFGSADPMLQLADVSQLPRIFKDLGLSRVLDPDENLLLNKYRRKEGTQNRKG